MFFALGAIGQNMWEAIDTGECIVPLQDLFHNISTNESNILEKKILEYQTLVPLSVLKVLFIVFQVC